MSNPCTWTFIQGAQCNAPAAYRSAGGLLLCHDHYTDLVRGVYRPIAIELSTGVVRGGITNGQVLKGAQ